MSLEDERAELAERSELADLGPKLPPLRTPPRAGPENAASEGADQSARRSGLYIALGMIMLLTVLVYLNMG